MVPNGTIGVGHARGLPLFLLVGLTLVGIAVVAQGASSPPASGDWVVTSTETVRIDNSTLDLRGDLDVLGGLHLDNSTIRVWSNDTGPRILQVHPSGAFTLKNSLITAADLSDPCLLWVEEGSTLSVSGSYLRGLGTTFADGLRSGGGYIATDASIEGTLFEACYSGLVINGSDVTIDDSIFKDCHVGVSITSDGHLIGEGIEVVGCEIGILGDDSDVHVRSSTFTACTEGIVSYVGDSEVLSSIFDDIGYKAISIYLGRSIIVGNAFRDSDGMGVVVQMSELTVVEDCTFSNLTVDLRAIYSKVHVKDTFHNWTSDEALFIYRSEFNISDVITNMSYWGLRTDTSSGSCTNLTTEGAAYSVYLERSKDVTIERIRAVGCSIPQIDRSSRGISLTYSDAHVSDVIIEDVRSGLVLESSRGIVEDVSVLNCTYQGVVSMWCTGLVLRRVTVENATDGFHASLYNTLVIEDCVAERCRNAGYNLTAHDSSSLIRCEAILCPTGVLVHLSAPRLVNCSWYTAHMGDGHPFLTYGVRSTLSYPSIEGGDLVGGDVGFKLSSSSARIKNVTFREVQLHCVEIIDSWQDVIEACTFVGNSSAVGIIVLKASPIIRDNLISDFRCGIAVYRGSDPRVENNLVRNMTEDGVQVFNRTRATLRENRIINCSDYGIHGAFFADVICREDVIEGSGRENIFLQVGASIDLQGAKVSGSTVGLHGVDSPVVRVAYCEFRDNGRGIVVSKVKNAPTMVEAVEVAVEECYFVNQSAYCIGIMDGYLEVVGCNLLDNGGGVAAWNSTVDLVDNSMARCWLFGLQTFDSTAVWTVVDLCRLYGSNIVGELEFIVEGGVLEISDGKMDLAPGSVFRAMSGSRLVFERVAWNATGSVFTVVDSEVDMIDVAFDRVGPLDDSSTQGLGVSISGSAVTLVNSTFENALGGITLMDSTAWFHGVRLKQNGHYGALLRNSNASMEWCEVKTVGNAFGLVLDGSALRADNVSVTGSYTLVQATDSSVELMDCILSGGTLSPLTLLDSSAVLINSSHSPQSYAIQGDGWIEVWWYVSARVVWNNASELAAVEVRIVDRLGQNVVTTHPTAEGVVSCVLVLALSGTENGVIEHGIHTVSATIHNYTARVTMLLVDSTEVELRLVDDDAPVIIVMSPSAVRYLTMNDTLEVLGTATDHGSGVDKVYMNLDGGRMIKSSEGENFSFKLVLGDGAHFINLTAVDHAGNIVVEVLEVLVETDDIKLLLTGPSDGFATSETTVLVRGFISRQNVTVTVDGLPANVHGNSYEFEVALDEGENRIDVDASDEYGHNSHVNVTVVADWTPPTLVVDASPLVNTTEEWVLVTGRMDGGRWVTFNGHPVVLRDGTFSVHFPVELGDNLVRVESVDAVGNAVYQEFIVGRTAPEVEEPRSRMWEVMPFILLVPILAVVEWYYLRGMHMWGDGRWP